MKEFIRENIGWLWRIPANTFTIYKDVMPDWILVIAVMILIHDTAKLFIELSELRLGED